MTAPADGRRGSNKQKEITSEQRKKFLQEAVDSEMLKGNAIDTALRLYSEIRIIRK